MVIGRPFLAVVYRACGGQLAQAAPKVTARFWLIWRVMPLGQVTVSLSSLMVKASRVSPPGTAGAQRLRLDGGVGAAVAVGGAGLPAPVGGVAVDFQPRRRAARPVVPRHNGGAPGNLSLVLVKLIVALLVPEGEPVLIAIDDTLSRDRLIEHDLTSCISAAPQHSRPACSCNHPLFNLEGRPDV